VSNKSDSGSHEWVKDEENVKNLEIPGSISESPGTRLRFLREWEFIDGEHVEQ
jgi:hypothetical protein